MAAWQSRRTQIWWTIERSTCIAPTNHEQPRRARQQRTGHPSETAERDPRRRHGIMARAPADQHHAALGISCLPVNINTWLPARAVEQAHLALSRPLPADPLLAVIKI